jgi:hypothetical protein
MKLSCLAHRPLPPNTKHLSSNGQPTLGSNNESGDPETKSAATNGLNPKRRPNPTCPKQREADRGLAGKRPANPGGPATTHGAASVRSKIQSASIRRPFLDGVLSGRVACSSGFAAGGRGAGGRRKGKIKICLFCTAATRVGLVWCSVATESVAVETRGLEDRFPQSHAPR